MTIKKGEDWGSRGTLPIGSPIAATDRELAAQFHISDTHELSGPNFVGLTAGGDLARTLGAQADADELTAGERTLVPIDLAIVTVDDRDIVLAASLIARRSWWRGPLLGAMNASYLGEWNLAPSGHPNDGRIDVIETDLSLSDRMKARKRLASGTHVPHPDISIRRLKTATWQLGDGRALTIDGVDYGKPTSVAVRVVADAVTIAI